tara:strand:- start:233 stop:436 length:204 start_codon:yes stop_codon:yes gene_type:complete
MAYIIVIETEKQTASVKFNETKKESMIMTHTITTIRRITSVPALASAVLALYGVALITHSVAGIAIV